MNHFEHLAIDRERSGDLRREAGNVRSARTFAIRDRKPTDQRSMTAASRYVLAGLLSLTRRLNSWLEQELATVENQSVGCVDSPSSCR